MDENQDDVPSVTDEEIGAYMMRQLRSGRVKASVLVVLTEKNFNKTVFADDTKSVVFFNDVEDDDPELDQYECFLQVRLETVKFFLENYL